MAEHETALLRYATRLVGNNAHLAEDVVQNTFVKLFKSWKQGTRPTGRLKSWLYRVTHNEAVDLVRRESRLNVLHVKHAEARAVDCQDGKHCPAPATERFAEVLQHVHKLRDAERQVLLLRLEEGLSYKEISAVTGRTEGNIGCILHNAVKKLSGMLTANSTPAVATHGLNTKQAL